MSYFLCPKGPWALGILTVRDEQELRELQGKDPALGLGMRYASLPMPAGVSK